MTVDAVDVDDLLLDDGLFTSCVSPTPCDVPITQKGGNVKKKRQRRLRMGASYKCRRCGEPKKGHVCRFAIAESTSTGGCRKDSGAMATASRPFSSPSKRRRKSCDAASLALVLSQSQSKSVGVPPQGLLNLRFPRSATAKDIHPRRAILGTATNVAQSQSSGHLLPSGPPARQVRKNVFVFSLFEHP